MLSVDHATTAAEREPAAMMRMLDVWWDGRLVGHLSQDQHGDLGFVYAEAWLHDAAAPPLSASLPKRDEPFTRREARSYFAGLLPEEDQRETAAEALGVPVAGLASSFVMRAALFFVFLVSLPTAFAQPISTPVVIGLSRLDDDQRLGIEINIGGAEKSELYLFDTGSYRFVSGWASGAPWWGIADVDTSQTKSTIYGPGSGEVRLDAHPGTATISLTGGGGSLSVSSSVHQVYDAYTNANPSSPTANWQPDDTFDDALTNAVTTNDPPFAHLVGPFFGVYGIAPFEAGEGFFGSISQLAFDSGLSRGYVVSGSGAPSLTVGLTAERIADFSATYPMIANGQGGYELPLVHADFTLSDGASSQKLSSVPTLFDTGTPPELGVFIEQGIGLDVSAYTFVQDGTTFLNHGTSLTMDILGAPYEITSTTSNPIAVFDAPTGNPGAIVYGLNFFEKYDVMYDLESQTVGVIAVPEPATVWCVLGFAAGVVIARLYRTTPPPKDSPANGT
jgi:HipA-like protein